MSRIPDYLFFPDVAPAAGAQYPWLEEWLLEPNLLIPGKKPVGPVKLNIDHTIVRGLVGGWMFFETGVLSVHARKFTKGAGTSDARLNGDFVLYTDGTAPGIYQGGIPDLNLSSWDKTTVLFGGDFRTASATTGTVGGIGGTTGTPGMIVSQSAIAGNRFAVINHNGYALNYTTFTDDKGHLQIFDVERASNNRQAYVGPIGKGLSASALATGSVSYYSKANAALGSDPKAWSTTPTAHRGTVNWHYMLWWDRVLTEEEMNSLNSDMYQILVADA